jgi:multidrug efflux pump subunit AcrA (membrane-fusion protein)
MNIPISIRRRKFILAISIALVLFVLVVLFPSWLNRGGGEEETKEISPSDMNVRVKTVTIETGEIPVTVKAVGFFVPRMQSPALVVSLIPGIVSRVEVREGQTVEAGTVIIRLDSRKSENALAKAKAGLRLVESSLQKATHGGLDTEQSDLDLAAKQAEVTAEQARLETERQKMLLADRLASEKAAFDAEKALEEAERRAKAAKEKADIFRTFGREMALAQLEASVEQSKAELAAAKLDCEAVEIRAPQSGRISGLKVNVGGAVDDKSVLAQVIGERTAVLRCWLCPADTEGIQLGASVIVRPVTSKEPLSGRVVSIGAELDGETGLVPVEAQLDPNQSGPARIGETVFAEITTQSNVKGIVVPISSIVVEDDKASLFTVDAKQIAHAVPIQILARTASRAVVSAKGLVAGAKVIADGNYNLPDGAHVVEEPSR